MWRKVKCWISKLNPVRIIRKVQNEWYERAEARQVFEIMELLRPSADSSPDLHSRQK
jgi:hypothetical protein